MSDCRQPPGSPWIKVYDARSSALAPWSSRPLALTAESFQLVVLARNVASWLAPHQPEARTGPPKLERPRAAGRGAHLLLLSCASSNQSYEHNPISKRVLWTILAWLFRSTHPPKFEAKVPAMRGGGGQRVQDPCKAPFQTGRVP